MHFEDLEVNECTVNSSELAGHDVSTSIRHPSSTLTVRTPSVTTLFGEKLGKHAKKACRKTNNDSKLEK